MDTHTKGLRELSLFSGAGGGLLGTKHLLGWKTIGYVEFAKYPQEILKARIRDGFLDDAPIWDDVTTFDGRPWRGCVDIVTAGFPCTPFSTAGKRQADGDSRNMWPDTIRIIREVKPKYCFLENVPGLLSATDQFGVRYFGTILGDLAESGYDARWRVLSAAEVGAPHKRDRIWIVANANGYRLETNANEIELRKSSTGCGSARRFGKMGSTSVWDTTRPLGAKTMGVGNGVASDVDRLKAIGNGQVPLCAATAWQLLTEPDSVDGAGG